MVSFKFQTIKLKEVPQGVSGLSFFIPEVKTFVDKQYNNIHSFAFYFEKDNTSPLTQAQLSVVNQMEIRKFKISNFEIVGERTPLKLFSLGNSIPASKKFTEINIPNNLQEIDLLLAHFVNTFKGTIYLVLRLNNIADEKQYLKNYVRYETLALNIFNNPTQAIKKFSFRPKVGAKRLKGIHMAFTDFSTGAAPYIGIGGVSKVDVGKLSVQINNLKNHPLLIHVKDYVLADVKRKVDFIELDEPIIGSSDIDCVFINGNIPLPVTTFTMYLTAKYSIY